MAFALTKFEVKSQEVDEAVTKRFRALITLDITQLNSDTALDIGDLAGTFWGVVDNTAMGLVALAVMRDIASRLDCFISQGGDGVDSRATVSGSAGAGEKNLSINSTTKFPDYTFQSGSAPTAHTVCFEVLFKPGEQPINCTLTA